MLINYMNITQMRIVLASLQNAKDAAYLKEVLLAESVEANTPQHSSGSYFPPNSKNKTIGRGMRSISSKVWSAVLCCAVLCCDVLCCAVLCCAVLCCAVLCCAVLCCAVLCCATVLRCIMPCFMVASVMAWL